MAWMGGEFIVEKERVLWLSRTISGSVSLISYGFSAGNDRVRFDEYPV